MTTISDIIDYVESLTGHRIHRDEGIHAGPRQRTVAGATICWMATPDAIRAAGEAGHDLLIGHESLFYPYDVVVQETQPPGWQDWPVNAQRRDLLDRFGLTHLRLHGSVDEICIFDDFAALLGLGEAVYADGLVKVFEIEECTLAELAQRVGTAMGMAGLRVACVDGMHRPVRRVGLPWGGMALFVNVGYQQQLIEQGCDVFIAGETDNYGFRFAQECGIPMIETSHELCENPGLAHFTEILARAFPDVAFRFYANPCVWQPYGAWHAQQTTSQKGTIE